MIVSNNLEKSGSILLSPLKVTLLKSERSKHKESNRVLLIVTVFAKLSLSRKTIGCKDYRREYSRPIGARLSLRPRQSLAVACVSLIIIMHANKQYFIHLHRDMTLKDSTGHEAG